MFIFTSILAAVGNFVANVGQIGCFWLLIADEPECPKSLIQ